MDHPPLHPRADAGWTPDDEDKPENSPSYQRVWRLLTAVSALLREGFDAEAAGTTVRVDTDFYLNLVLMSGIPDGARLTRALSIDSTALPSFAVTHYNRLPGGGWRSRSKDPGARAGRRSASNNRTAEPFFGRDFQIGVQTAEGDDDAYVENFVRWATLKPSGEDYAPTVLQMVDWLRGHGIPVDEVTADGGYTRGFDLLDGLAAREVKVNFKPAVGQRGPSPCPVPGVFVQAGQPYCSSLPAEFRVTRRRLSPEGSVNDLRDAEERRRLEAAGPWECKPQSVHPVNGGCGTRTR